jgi:hypothetical protein
VKEEEKAIQLIAIQNARMFKERKIVLNVTRRSY